MTFFKRYVSSSTDAREQQWRTSTTCRTPGGPSNKLTLNLGLRLAVISPETVNEAGNGGWLDIGCAPGSAPCQTQGSGQILIGGVGDVDLAGNVQNTLNWEPRLGVTYQINDKTVVRAGYGRSHDIGTFGSTFGHAVTQNLPVLSIQEINAPANYAAVFNLAQGPPPATFIDSPTGRFQLPDGVNSFVRTNKMRLLRTDNWNITVQRQLSTDTSVELAYVGNHGSQYMAEDGPDENLNQASIVGYPNVPLNNRRPFFNQFGWTQGFRAFMNDAEQRLQLDPDQVRQEHDQGMVAVGALHLCQGESARRRLLLDRPRAELGNAGLAPHPPGRAGRELRAALRQGNPSCWAAGSSTGTSSSRAVNPSASTTATRARTATPAPTGPT